MTAGGDATQRVQNSQNVAQASGSSQAAVTVNHYYLRGLQRPVVVPVEELAAARARFEALPLARVPDPARLPAASHMPLLPNALFVGRAPELLALARALKSGATATATGLGGIGKTQLASAFAFRYGQFFASGVFWLSFAHADAVPAEIARCGGPLALNLQPGYEGLALPDQLGLVAAAFAADLPRLLIFDNCEDEALLATWLPRTGAARVLVTSWRREWSAGLNVRAVPIGVLPRAESVTLLRKFRDDLPADDLDLGAIAAELGDLPLALHMAGSFLKRYRHAITPAGYLAELKAPGLLDHPSLTKALEHSPTTHEQHVARTFGLSLEKLDAAETTDARACDLLDRAAFFVPGESVPRALLIKSAGIEASDRFAAEDGLKRLTDLGLIEEEAEGAVRLHRLLAAFVRGRCEDADGARTAVEAALVKEAYRLNQAGLPAPVAVLQPHLRALAATAEAALSDWAADLYGNLGHHLNMIADFAGAEAQFERALAIDEKAYGPDHPKVAGRLSGLGSVLEAEGDFAGAEAQFERAFAIYEKAYSLGHRDIARDVAAMGAVFQAEGDFAGVTARLIGVMARLERALTIYETIYEKDYSLDIARDVDNLGTALQPERRFAGVMAHFTGALTILLKGLWPEGNFGAKAHI